MDEALKILLRKDVPDLVLLGRRDYNPRQLYIVSLDEDLTPLEYSSPIITRLNPRDSYENKIDTLRKIFLDLNPNFNSYEVSGRGLTVNRLFRTPLVDWAIIPYKISDEQFKKATVSVSLLDRKRKESFSNSGRFSLGPVIKSSGRFRFSKLEFF